MPFETRVPICSQIPSAVYRPSRLGEAQPGQAGQVIVVADSNKPGLVSSAVVCPAQKIDLLITDNGIYEEAAGASSASGVKILAV
jgi:hypothetical protein